MNEERIIKVGAYNTVGVQQYGTLVHVEIDEPWVGDSDVGFGRTSYTDLSAKQALLLASYLIEAAGKAMES